MYEDRILRNAVLNPYKVHLATLPDLPVPVKTVNGDGNILVIFPIFQVGDNDHSIEHHIARSACWAQRTWTRYTDANSQGVGMKFYIEESVKDRAIPILKQNYVQDEDLLFFDGRPFEGDPCTFLGKKHAFYGDPQLASYKWVLQMDSDMFIGRPIGESSVGKPSAVKFFEKFQDLSYENLGACWVFYDKTPMMGLEDRHWINRILPKGTSRQELAKEWSRRARTLIDPWRVLAYERETSAPLANGGIYAFPARHWHMEYPERIEWLVKAGRVLQDDEAAISLWITQGNKVFGIDELTGLQMIQTLRTLVNGEGILEREGAGDIYLLHGGSCAEEMLFRDHMTN